MLVTMLDPDALAPERIRPLYRREYDQLVELGVFENERVELLRGALVAMSPQSAGHAEVITRLTGIFASALFGRAAVRVQLPLALSDDSEPEPDVALVAAGDYGHAHPSTAHLVVEVSTHGSPKNAVLKAALYAEAAIPEYWVVDLAAAAVVVHRRPAGGRYQDVARLCTRDTAAPQAFPDVAIRVAALLPG